MKNPSTDIFDLIKSLGKGEKRYFKSYSSIYKKSNKHYLLLFDAIAKQNEYNETALRQQFKGKAFTKQLAVAKSFLHDRILKVLDSYHESHAEKIRSNIHYAEILYNKGLYSQAEKILGKMKILSEKYDLHIFLPEILLWEHRLAFQSFNIDKSAEINNEFKNCFHLLLNIHILRDLASTLYSLTYGNLPLNEKERMRRIKKIMNHPLVKKENELTFQAKEYYYHIHHTYWSYKNNPYKTISFLKKKVKQYEMHNEKIKNNQNTYVYALGGLIETCLECKLYDEAIAQIEKCNMLIKNTTNFSEKSFTWLMYNDCLLKYFRHIGEFEKGAEIIPCITKEYIAYKKELSEHEKITLHISIAIIWFGNNEFKKCISSLYKILNDYSKNIRNDIEHFIRLFYLMAHFEAKSNDFLIHLTQSTYHFFQKQNNTSEFEKLFVDFFRILLPKADNNKEMIDAFKQLYNQLLPLTKNSKEKHIFDYFDFISWLESKIENRPFAEVVREKAKAD
ncbi:MAG: hypothetical protein HY841_12605 [Bacteroidetes bacterium]|nr:hypothetical protein [Bacteroidota bacterium]